MTTIRNRLDDLRKKVEGLKLKPLTSTEEIPILLKKKGYNIITSDDKGNFCIGIESGCTLEGRAMSKVNYTLILRINNVVEEYEKIYRWDDFFPMIDLIVTEAKSLYPLIVEEQKIDKQAAVLKTFIDGILSTIDLKGRSFLTYPIMEDGNLSMILYTKVLSNLFLSVKLSAKDIEEKITRLLTVCSLIPDVVTAERPISLKGTIIGNDWDTIPAEGQNKNYDKKINRHFTNSPYAEKSVYAPRANKLVQFLKKKDILYGYTDKGDFIIQYAPNGDDYGVIRWNDIDFGYTDFHYQISKKGALKRRSKDFFRGLVEKLTEDEFIRLLTLALENNAFHVETQYKILRHTLISSIARNRLPEGIRVSAPFAGRWTWNGKAFGPKLYIGIPDINVCILLEWENLKQFVVDHNQIEKTIPVIDALRFIASRDSKVKFIKSPEPNQN